MQNRHINRLRYFEEQDYTTRKFVIPFIEKFRKLKSGMQILEIGCGEGGNLKPFLEKDCCVTGIDLSENKIGLAKQFFENHPQKEKLELICDDIYNLQPPYRKFDIVIMRDVIEHIHDQQRFMIFVRHFMYSDSQFFLAFPPWQNPFGGHQQICKSKILHLLPYFHLLPGVLYRIFLTLCGESKATVANLLEVKESGISIERFEKTYLQASFRLTARQLYLINPNYEAKFGLKPVKQNRLITAFPGVRNFVTTSAYYLLSP